MAKTAFNKKALRKKIGLKFVEETGKVLHLEIALYGAGTWTLWKVEQKYLISFEMWCWRRMEKISRTDSVRNEEVLHRVKEERNNLQTIKRRKADWIGHICRRNCLLKYVIEGKRRKNRSDGNTRKKT
jgi:hypothetical protein